MAYARTLTRLPLAEWARLIGIHPAHFEGIEYTPNGRSPSLCAEPLFQYSWQESDRSGREEIAQAIAEAERMIEQELGYHLIPTWDREEWQPYPRHHIPEVSAFGIDTRWYLPAMRANWGWFRQGGQEARTLLRDGATIVWSDADGDGQDDTGTVTAPVAEGTDPCEVEAYYPEHSGDPAYQIRPVTVTIAGLVATITFKRWLAVSETVIGGMLDIRSADWTDDGDFLDEIDIYRHYNDPSVQATLLWEPAGCGACGDSGCVQCAYASQTGCLHLRTPRADSMVAVTPGTWNATTQAFDSASWAVPRGPDLVQLYYRSGWQAPSGCPTVMDPRWARAVAYLACTLFDRQLCDCTASFFDMYREDFAVTSGGEGTKTFGGDLRKLAAECPFGTQRGALMAWNLVRSPNTARVRAGAIL